MKKLNLLAVLVCLIIIFTFLNLSPTALVISSFPSLELHLTKTTYLPDELLEGSILLTFTEDVDANSAVALKLADQTKSLPILKILKDLAYNYTTSKLDTKLSSPETNKTLLFTSSDIKQLAFSLPKGSKIDSLDFDIEGVEYQNSLPKSPSIDLLMDDSVDWLYEGEFLTWSSPKTSDGLDLLQDSSSQYIQGPSFYCNLIDLPLSDKFNISVRYTKETGADLKATILNFADKASVIKSNLYCSLPTTPASEWSSCEISLDMPIGNDHLVCIYTTAPSGNIKYFSLTVDDESPFTGYECDFTTTLQGSGTCTKLNSDFFIQVYSPLYKKELTNSTFLENSLLSSQEVADYLSSYLSTCASDICPIPFTISSNSAGKILIKNLKLDYSTATSHFSTSKFYILDSLTKSTILKINGQDVTEQEIQIPLSLFGFKAPVILGDSESLEVRATLGSSTDAQLIDIYKYGIPAEISLDKAEIILNNFVNANPDTLLILDALGIKPEEELETIEGYKSQLSSLANATLTPAEIQLQKTQLNTELKTYLDNLPTYILIKGKIKQSHRVSLEDLTDNILEESQKAMKEEILNLQQQSNVQSISIAFWITNYAGIQEEKTLISKTILNPIGNIYIIEKIPKTIAASVDSLTISTDYLVVEPDPILKFRSSATTETINYLVPGNVLNQVAETKTLLIPVEATIIPSVKFSCGDQVCTEKLEDYLTCPQDCAKKMPWIFIIVILIIIISGVWYLNFYRGKWNLKELLVKLKIKKEAKEPAKIPEKKAPEKLFSTDADHVNLRSYIYKSLEKNIPRSHINKLLLKQGWKQEQIDFVFKEIKK